MRITFKTLADVWKLGSVIFFEVYSYYTVGLRIQSTLWGGGNLKIFEIEDFFTVAHLKFFQNFTMGGGGLLKFFKLMDFLRENDIFSQFFFHYP